MARELPLFEEPQLPGRYADRNPLDFASLYDRYAPALLGVITRIVIDNEQAVELLAATFTKARQVMNQYRPEKQSVFTWLLSLARSTALDSLREKKQAPPASVRLTPDGKVVTLPTNIPDAPATLATTGTDPKLTELLNSVLFGNCTPEQAACKIGIPAETARQQLRLAMQQLRAAQQAR